MYNKCPICKNHKFTAIYTQNKTPIVQLIPINTNISEQIFGSLNIVQCRHCQHIFNQKFTDADIIEIYNSFLTNTPVHISMNQHLQSIAKLIGLENYQNKEVLEIGSGSGHLSRLLAKDAHSVVMYEPSKALFNKSFKEKNISLKNEFFSSQKQSPKVDLVICRHVLEHIYDPIQFLKQIADALKIDGIIFLEVPNYKYIENNEMLVDFVYPHIHYFNLELLQKFTSQIGLECINASYLKQGHDFWLMLKKTTNCLPATKNHINKKLHVFPKALHNKRKKFLHSCKNKKIALYGAAWHGVAFLNLYHQDAIFSFIFDDNPNYVNYSLFSPTQQLPVTPLNPDNFFTLDIIIITAYLHDTVIAEQLREKGFNGMIISLSQGTTGGFYEFNL